MTEKKYLKILSWNINSVKNRFTSLEQFMLENDVDIVCLQETKHVEGWQPRLGAYNQFSLPGPDGRRGLLTYIKNTIPVSEITINTGNNSEAQFFKIKLKNNSIYLINIYVGDKGLQCAQLAEQIGLKNTILVGDLNAKHSKLGVQNKNKDNVNGKDLWNYISETDNVRVINSNEPTHLQGGRLDYVLLFMSSFKLDDIP